MTEELDFETYLSVTKDKFEIFLFDKKKCKNLYKDCLNLCDKLDLANLDYLSKFLDNNIFKIEKLAGTFIKNICLIIENDKNFNVNICIKKKNYDNLINQKNFENTLSEIKDLFQENYPEQTIAHMIINNYLINGKEYSFFTSDINADHLCLEINFISVPNNLIDIFDKILEKYQIKIVRHLNGNYVNNFFKEDDSELSEKAHKLINGLNNNEVIIIPKNIENKGFFEKFFRLFS